MTQSGRENLLARRSMRRRGRVDEGKAEIEVEKKKGKLLGV